MFSANKTPLYKACAELLAIILHDVTTETCYLASVCEIGNQIEATDVGFTVRVHGFDDKLLELVVSPSFFSTYLFRMRKSLSVVVPFFLIFSILRRRCSEFCLVSKQVVTTSFQKKFPTIGLTLV